MTLDVDLLFHVGLGMTALGLIFFKMTWQLSYHQVASTVRYARLQ